MIGIAGANSWNRFTSKKGSNVGNSSDCYTKAYFFLEKIRSLFNIPIRSSFDNEINFIEITKKEV